MRLLPFLALAGFLTACGPGGVDPASLIQPSVRVHHLAIRNIGISGGTLDIALAFHNPNKVKLQGTHLSAGLDIEGSHFGDVDMTNPFSLVGKDTTLVTVPLTFRWSGVASAARSAIEYGAVNYAINGRFAIATPVTGTPFEVPFSGQGSVPLLRP